MSDSFNGYQAEYEQIKQSIQSKLDNDVKRQQGEPRKAILRRITMELEEADEIVDQMEMEAKGQAKLMIKVRQFKSELAKYKQTVASTPASDRDALLSSAPAHQAYAMDLDDTDTGLSSAQAQRSRLLQSTSVLDSSSARLDNAQAMSAENEAVGAGILQSLFGQRIQLETARDGLDEADGSIGRAQGTIKKMVRQMYKQRFILWSFVFVLTLVLIFVLWNKFRK